MAIEVKADIPGATAVNEGSWYLEATRIFCVSGLIGQGAQTISAAMNRPEIPTIGSLHPDPNMQGLRALSYEASCPDVGIVFITVRYLNTGLRRYRGGARHLLVDSWTNINGQIITVEHEGDVRTASVSSFLANGSFSVQGVLGNIHHGSGYLIAPAVDPMALTTAWTGRVNGATFLGCAAGTLLLEAIDYDTVGTGNVAWNVTAEFSWRADGWNPYAAYLDDNGLLPVDAGPTAYKLVQRYYTADFSQFPLFL